MVLQQSFGFSDGFCAWTLDGKNRCHTANIFFRTLSAFVNQGTSLPFPSNYKNCCCCWI